MVSFIDFDEFVKFYGMTVAELKKKSYSELEKMEAEMTNSKSLEKLSNHNFQNAARKFLTCFEFLNQWFSEGQ